MSNSRTAAPDAFSVIEGVSGVYAYHLARNDSVQALCDPTYRAMRTSIPLSGWGFRGHLSEKYCAQCETIARSEGAADLGVARTARD